MQMKLTRKRLRRLIQESFTQILQESTIKKSPLYNVIEEIGSIDNFAQGAGVVAKINKPGDVEEYKSLLLFMRRVLSHHPDFRLPGLFKEESFRFPFEMIANKKLSGELNANQIRSLAMDAEFKRRRFSELGFEIKGEYTDEPHNFLFYISNLFDTISDFFDDLNESEINDRSESNEIATEYAKRAMIYVEDRTPYGYKHRDFPRVFWEGFVEPYLPANYKEE